MAGPDTDAGTGIADSDSCCWLVQVDMECQFLQTVISSLEQMGKETENFENHREKLKLIAVLYVANFAVAAAAANQTDWRPADESAVAAEKILDRLSFGFRSSQSKRPSVVVAEHCNTVADTVLLCIEVDKTMMSSQQQDGANVLDIAAAAVHSRCYPEVEMQVNLVAFVKCKRMLLHCLCSSWQCVVCSRYDKK